MTDKPRPNRRKPSLKARRSANSFALLLSHRSCALVIRTLAFEPFNIPSSSMVPTLLVGDFLFVSKFPTVRQHRNVLGLAAFKGRIFESRTETRRRHRLQMAARQFHRLHQAPDRPAGRHNPDARRHPLHQRRAGDARPAESADFGPHDGKAADRMSPDYSKSICRAAWNVSSARWAMTMPLDNTEVFVVPPHHYFFMGDNRDNSQTAARPTAASASCRRKTSSARPNSCSSRSMMTRISGSSGNGRTAFAGTVCLRRSSEAHSNGLVLLILFQCLGMIYSGPELQQARRYPPPACGRG